MVNSEESQIRLIGLKYEQEEGRMTPIITSWEATWIMQSFTTFSTQRQRSSIRVINSQSCSKSQYKKPNLPLLILDTNLQLGLERKSAAEFTIQIKKQLSLIKQKDPGTSTCGHGLMESSSSTNTARNSSFLSFLFKNIIVIVNNKLQNSLNFFHSPEKSCNLGF